MNAPKARLNRRRARSRACTTQRQRTVRPIGRCRRPARRIMPRKLDGVAEGGATRPILIALATASFAGAGLIQVVHTRYAHAQDAIDQNTADAFDLRDVHAAARGQGLRRFYAPL